MYTNESTQKKVAPDSVPYERVGSWVGPIQPALCDNLMTLLLTHRTAGTRFHPYDIMYIVVISCHYSYDLLLSVPKVILDCLYYVTVHNIVDDIILL